jgi:hypothetical protein
MHPIYLLLGSAAALAVVCNAHATDAIVAAAPKSTEYVRICDIYGAGYFFVPGTQTCLNISGELRYQVNWTSAGASKWSSYSGSLFYLYADAKNNSEYGTVYSFIRVEGTAEASTGGGNIYNTGLYVGIGGFEAGHYDTAWTRFFDYGGFTDEGGRYALMTNTYAAYQGTAGAISYLASVDDLQSTAGKTYGLNAAAKGTFGDMSAGVGVAYDGAAKSTAMKAFVSAQFDMISLRLIGLYADKTSNAYTQDIKGFTLIAALKAELTENFYAAVDYSYSFDPKTYYLVGDIGWHAAGGFDVLASGSFDSGTKAKAAFLRLTRTF